MRTASHDRPNLRLVEGVSDGELITRYRSGDTAAFNAIVHRYRDSLTRYAHSIVSNHARAEEIVQEAFAKLAHNQTDVQAEALKSWLYRVVRNSAINEKRDTKRHATLHAMHNDALPFGQRDTRSPEQLLHELLQQTAVQELLDELLNKHAEVLRLRYFQDLTNEEIAKTLKIPLGTVMSRLSRAKRELRKLIEERGLTTDFDEAAQRQAI
ncbi:MAG: hypothetical protein ACD_43C00046G0004 [uncultured bacterium]|nr:MAG: hypothetical protein ACD_43C00046G0004 [uncultured bacterium]